MSRPAIALLLCTLSGLASAQSIPPATPTNPATAPAISAGTSNIQAPTHVFIPANPVNLSPGVLELLKLEGQFSQSVTDGGGKAFATWFADDGVTLNNGQPAVRGRTAIASIATWDPANYKLSWYAEGAQTPTADTGFTWGHYDATTIDKDGKATTLSGRYITFWKKVNGKWKVALDASANEPPPTYGLPTP
jgi:ketosteroid isomerase-like protein